MKKLCCVIVIVCLFVLQGCTNTTEKEHLAFYKKVGLQETRLTFEAVDFLPGGSDTIPLCIDKQSCILYRVEKKGDYKITAVSFANPTIIADTRIEIIYPEKTIDKKNLTEEQIEKLQLLEEDMKNTIKETGMTWDELDAFMLWMKEYNDTGIHEL